MANEETSSPDVAVDGAQAANVLHSNKYKCKLKTTMQLLATPTFAE